MAEYLFHWVDVFTHERFGGNPLAVFPNAVEIPEACLQSLARELNLSETTFVYPAEGSGDVRVRIFTPAHELPFAGHPTLGTAYVLSRVAEHRARGRDRLVLELKVGPIEVEIEGDSSSGRARLRAPAPQCSEPIGAAAARAQFAAGLGLEAGDLDAALPIQTMSCGVPWTLVPVRSLEALTTISLNLSAFRAAAGATGCRTWYPFFWMGGVGEHAAVRSRSFAPLEGVVEDLATGSAAGPMLAYLLQHGAIQGPEAQLRIDQGVEMGRPSRLDVAARWDGRAVSDLTVAGGVVPVLTGRFNL